MGAVCYGMDLVSSLGSKFVKNWDALFKLGTGVLRDRAKSTKIVIFFGSKRFFISITNFKDISQKTVFWQKSLKLVMDLKKRDEPQKARILVLLRDRAKLRCLA